MGLSTEGGTKFTGAPETEVQKTRFGAHFPRAFACAYSLTGDEAAAREVVAKAFASAFSHPPELDEDEFVMLLFTTVSDNCRSMPAGAGESDLSRPERELLAMVFDARLSGEKVRRLMRMTEEGVSAMLLGALRKLRASTTPATVKESLRPV